MLLKVEELPETESGLEFVFLLNSPPAFADSAASYKISESAFRVLGSGLSKEVCARSRCRLGHVSELLRRSTGGKGAQKI